MKGAFRQLWHDMRSEAAHVSDAFGIVWGTIAVSLLLAGWGLKHQQIRR
jgi:hypothetical protein